MAAPKGQKKAGGRVKGTPNKRTKEAVERVEWVLSLLEPHIEKDVRLLSPKDRMMLWNDLQEYVRPKLSRQDTNVTINEVPKIDLHIGKDKA